MTLPFYEHGEQVRLQYAPVAGNIESPAGRSTDEERPDGHADGIFKRFKKRSYAHHQPQALGWIKATYSDAIEYTGIKKEMRGMGFFIALVGGAFGIIGGAFPIISFLSMSFGSLAQPGEPWPSILFRWCFMFPAGIAFVAFGIWFLVFACRLDLFRPADQPLLFDRKHRKVYRISQQERPGLFGVFKRWPLIVNEFDWDLVDAEHQVDVVVGTNMVRRNHFLMFLVRQSDADPTIIDSFQIANAFSLSEDSVPAVWEHIRRFMEENGPHLPAPDEPLANLDPPANWWQSLGATGVFGPGYVKRWNENTAFMLAMHLTFPVTLPMFLLCGTGNWLSFKTALSVDWPDEVIQRVGPATRRG